MQLWVFSSTHACTVSEHGLQRRQRKSRALLSRGAVVCEMKMRNSVGIISSMSQKKPLRAWYISDKIPQTMGFISVFLFPHNLCGHVTVRYKI